MSELINKIHNLLQILHNIKLLLKQRINLKTDNHVDDDMTTYPDAIDLLRSPFDGVVYFCVSPIVSNTVTLITIVKKENTNIHLEYRISNEKDFTLCEFDSGNTFLIATNRTVYFRGINPNGFGLNSSDIENGLPFFYFDNSNKVKLTGDLLTLINYENIPDVIPVDYCFMNFFKNNDCIGDAENLILSATTLKKYCYYGMFSGCVNLNVNWQNKIAHIGIPELPATTLDDYCYSHMFYNCSKIAITMELPATNLTKYCYSSMFENCTSLIRVQDVYATTLDTGSLNSFCKGCSSLKLIYHTYFSNWGENNTVDWLSGVSNTGEIFCPYELEKTYDTSHIPLNWTVYYNVIDDNIINETIRESKIYTPESGKLIGTCTVTYLSNDGCDYMSFRSDSAFTIYLSNEDGNSPDCQYSFNKNIWNVMPTEQGSAITVNNSTHTIYVRGTNPTGFSSSVTIYSHFVINGNNIWVEGPLMSLINNSDVNGAVPNGFCFYRLFAGNTSITNVTRLKLATSNSYSCYSEMYSGTSIECTPVISVLNGTYSYSNAFKDCVNLNKVIITYTSWESYITNNWLSGVPDLSTSKAYLPTSINVTKLIRGANTIPENWEIIAC